MLKDILNVQIFKSTLYQFEKFRVRDPSTKKYLCFRICDTRGVEEGLSIKSEDLGFILHGNLPNHYTVLLCNFSADK